MAIGADSRDVRRMVLRQGMIVAGIGVAIGLGAAVALTRLPGFQNGSRRGASVRVASIHTPTPKGPARRGQGVRGEEPGQTAATGAPASRSTAKTVVKLPELEANAPMIEVMLSVGGFSKAGLPEGEVTRGESQPA